MRHKPFFVLSFLCCLVSTVTVAQINDNALPIEPKGLPFVTNYSSDEYNAFSQNWGAVKDSLGIMYFANGSGVLIYDGVHWSLIELPNKSHVKSITIASTGRVFVGASNELGYIQSNQSGTYQYVSLVNELDKKYRNFSTVWECIALPQGVFFRTDMGIYIWYKNKFEVVNSKEKEIKRIYAVDGVIYTRIAGIGLMQVSNGQLKLVAGGEKFSQDEIVSILPYETHHKKGLLIGTYTDGFFVYVNGRKERFHTSADDFFSSNKLYTGTKLNNGDYAFATLQQGVIVLNKAGEKQFILNDANVLNSLTVHGLFQDDRGLIWATLNNGIAKIEYPSPFSWFSKTNNIDARVQVVRSYKGQIYAGLANGLYRLETETGNFELVENLRDKIWDITIFRDELLVAANDTVYQLVDNKLTSIIAEHPSAFCVSKVDSNRVFITTAKGLRSIYYKNNNWIDEGKIDGVTSGVYTILEMASGELWLETSETYLWRVSFDDLQSAKELKNPSCEKFGQSEGLPDDIGNIHKWKDQLFYFSNNEKRGYVYNLGNSKFEYAEGLRKLLVVKDSSFLVGHIDANDNIWFFKKSKKLEYESFVAWNTHDGLVVEALHQIRLENKLGGSYTKYFDAKNKLLWLSGKKSVIRQDLQGASLGRHNFHAVINKVSYANDSILLSGAHHKVTASLPFSRNSFRFKFACPFFYEESKNQFQVFLEGFDDTWLSWSKETKKDYTNIPEGNYTFRVRAKNIFGDISEEDTFTFTILPPWYRTWWAYLLYMLITAFLVFQYSKWRSRQLTVKNLALERVVSSRTTEIKEKNHQLEAQTERLKELDTMKTRLFANISHEFRTPLTLIKGPIEKLEQDRKNAISTTNIKMIRRNANRLLNLVNQLLDLSKLDSGKLVLNLNEGDVFKCIRAASSSFSSLAAQRNIDYQISLPHESLWASFDRDKIEKVVYNLLSNAFKFTDDGGEIRLSLDYVYDELLLKVSDTGCGIEGDKLHQIFDRFFQVDDSYTKEKAGSGIGLSLTRELVHLMHGEIYVESEKGKGSIFKVTIPLEEIIDYNSVSSEEQPYEMVQQDVIEASAVLTKVSRHGTILIIEDNADMRHFIKEQLLMDFEIIEATNGKEGLKEAVNSQPDLIITDLMMPKMDGIALCKALKSDINTSHIPIIMLTAKAGIENKLEGLETGADDYLTKPFNAKELLVRVHNLVNQRKKLRKLFSAKASISPEQVTVNSLDQQFLERMMKLLEDRYSDATFGVPEMQQALGMSKTQLHCKTKALTNHPPGELLRNFRLERAAQLLAQQADNISQIAYSVGFNSLSYFTKCFKKHYHMSPSAYAQQGV